MKVAVVIVLFLLISVVTINSTSILPTSADTTHAFEAANGAAIDVLRATTDSSCCVFIIADGTISHSSVSKDVFEKHRMRGLAVFESASTEDEMSNNTTRIQLSELVRKARALRGLCWCVSMVVMSEDVQFLTTFAEVADTGRLMLEATRLLLVCRLQLVKLNQLLRQYWLFSMMNTIILNLNKNTNRCSIYTHLPYRPAGVAPVVQVGSWSTSLGLTITPGQTLFPEKYNNFYGSPMNMTVFPFSPYWMEVDEELPDGSRISRLTGRDYIMLETLAKALNFSIQVLPPGDWDEVMHRLETREAYLSPIKLAIMPHLLKVYDFTFNIERATLGFSMAKPTLKPRWQSLYYPLTPDVWLSIVGALLLVPAILILMKRINNTFENEWKKLSMWSVVEMVVGTLFCQNLSRPVPSNASSRLMIGTWLVFVFILGTAYRGKLTAFLTVPKYPPRAETLKELIATGARVKMPPDLVDFYNNFKNADSVILKTLVARSSFVPSFEVGLQEAIDKQSAYLYERLFLELMLAEHFTADDGSTQLYVAKENIMPGYCAWPMTRDAPFKTSFDKYLTAFHEAGLIEKWSVDILKSARLASYEKQIRNNQENGKNEREEEEEEEKNDGNGKGIKALTLVHMQGPIFLWLLGLLLSAVTFCSEFLFAHCSLRRHRSLPSSTC